MLNPPTPEVEEDTKRSEAVFRAERLEQQPGGWTREVTFFFDGEDYAYGLQASRARTEEEARRVLYGSKPNDELNACFLRDVHLDMTRPH